MNPDAFFLDSPIPNSFGRLDANDLHDGALDGRRRHVSRANDLDRPVAQPTRSGCAFSRARTPHGRLGNQTLGDRIQRRHTSRRFVGNGVEPLTSAFCEICQRIAVHILGSESYQGQGHLYILGHGASAAGRGPSPDQCREQPCELVGPIATVVARHGQKPHRPAGIWTSLPNEDPTGTSAGEVISPGRLGTHRTLSARLELWEREICCIELDIRLMAHLGEWIRHSRANPSRHRACRKRRPHRAVAPAWSPDRACRYRYPDCRPGGSASPRPRYRS